jgi:hypothetical protein
MRKIVYGSAILVGALVTMMTIGHLPRTATTSPDKTAGTLDVRKLGETIDMKSMPLQKLLDEVYH